MSSGLLSIVGAGLKDLMTSETVLNEKSNLSHPDADGGTVNGLATHVEAFKQSSLGQPVHDRVDTLEELVHQAALADVDSPTKLQLAETINSRLWNDLNHPPTSFLGKQFMYRAADGSGNVSLFTHNILST